MTRLLILTIFVISLLVFVETSFCEDVAVMMFRDARAMGMGNAYEAITADTSAFHYNPAGLARADGTKFEFLVSRARISRDLTSELKTVSELVDNVRAVTSSDDPLEDDSISEEREYVIDRFEKMLTENLGMMLDSPSIALVVPSSIGRVTFAVGGAVYTQAKLSMYLRRRGIKWKDPIKDMLDNEIIYDLSAQVGYQFGWSVGLPLGPSKLYAGMSFRRLNRQVFSDLDDPMTVEDLLNPNGPDGIEGTEDDFKNRYFNYEEEDLLKLASDSFESVPGYSVDFGVASELMDGLSLALAVRNLSGTMKYPNGDRDLPRNTVVSAAVKPLLIMDKLGMPGISGGLLDLTLAASYDDPNGDDALEMFKNDQLSDHIHLGAEAVIFPQSVLSLGIRWGNNQGYLTTGITVRLGPLYVDFARYGDLETDWNILSAKIAF